MGQGCRCRCTTRILMRTMRSRTHTEAEARGVGFPFAETDCILFGCAFTLRRCVLDGNVIFFFLLHTATAKKKIIEMYDEPDGWMWCVCVCVCITSGCCCYGQAFFTNWMVGRKWCGEHCHLQPVTYKYSHRASRREKILWTQCTTYL